MPGGVRGGSTSMGNDFLSESEDEASVRSEILSPSPPKTTLTLFKLPAKTPETFLFLKTFGKTTRASLIATPFSPLPPFLFGATFFFSAGASSSLSESESFPSNCRKGFPTPKERLESALFGSQKRFSLKTDSLLSSGV